MTYRQVYLPALPIYDFNFELSKQHFWDAIRLRYGWSIANLPSTSPRGSRFIVLYLLDLLSCKKGFVSIRHNDLRDLTAKMLSEVCKDTKIERKLTQLTGEEIDTRTANTTNETRSDIAAPAVWERGK